MPNYFKADYKTIRARLRHIDWTKELSDSFENSPSKDAFQGMMSQGKSTTSI